MAERKSSFRSAEELRTIGVLPDALAFYPEGNQYSLDPTCEAIVKEFERLRWQVDGVEVKFWMAGDEAIAVAQINASNYRLHFGRGHRGVLGRSALVNIGTIDLPREQLMIYDDMSGPSYRKYTGLAWERHKHEFWENERRLNKHGIAYTGSTSIDGHMSHKPGELPMYLVLNRYENHGIRPPWFPTHYSTDRILTETNGWLQHNVLGPLHKKA